MPLLNYTTKVSVSRTASQIQAKLAECGAKSILFQYGERGRIIALAFQVNTPSGNLPIRLPIDSEATFEVLKRQAGKREIPKSFATDEQAYRVAWRTVKDWVEAQMSLLETEMVRLEEIFLPYVMIDGKQTVYEILSKRGFELTEGRG